MKRALTLVALVAFSSSPLMARPFIAEDLDTIGKHVFEAGFMPSKRYDRFGDPLSTMETVNMHMRFRLGLTKNFDIGMGLLHATQTLDMPDSKLSGSQSGMLAPEIKLNFNSYLGFLGIWHVKAPQKFGQNLPVSRGHDWEFLGLAKLPTKWPINFNAGYIIRQSYQTKFGVDNAEPTTYHPGDIFESKASLEIPLPMNFSLINEVAYYNVGQRKVGQTEIPNSSGDVCDYTVGAGWTWKSWAFNLGASFGLLDERLTSFDIERGSGDATIRFGAYYRLTPRKPESW